MYISLSSILLYLLLFLISIDAKNVPSVAPWTPINWRTLPHADTDKVEVLYLVYPLLEESFGNYLGDLGLHHGAIAFHNINQQYNITINYDAFNFMRSSVFPVVNPNGTLTWENGGASFVYAGINETYWTSAQYVVTTINGSQYWDFLSLYNANINESYPYYNMVSVVDSFGSPPYVSSWDCFDYAFDAFNYLGGIGAKFNDELSVYRNYANFYGGVPEDVTILYAKDPDTRKEVVGFYAVLEGADGNMTWLNYLDNLYKIIALGDVYVKNSEKYWAVSLHFPYIDCSYDLALLPGQNASKLAESKHVSISEKFLPKPSSQPIQIV